MRRWTNKKIAFVAVLIATSVAFTIIGASALAITALPSFKLAFAGLPVKITGYLFGPLIGFITGFLSDILSFLFIPTYYNPLYSVALAITGMIPGIVAWLYLKFGKNYFGKEFKIQRLTNKVILLKNYVWFNEYKIQNEQIIIKFNEKIRILENKIAKIQKVDVSTSLLNFNYISSFVILSLLLIAILIIISYIPANFFVVNSLTRSRTSFYVFTSLGLSAMLVFITFMRFLSKPKTFLSIIPIIVFSALIEFITLPIIAYADFLTLNIEFQISLVGSLLLSPFKIWGNLIIILIAYRIIAPLVKNIENNGWV